MAKPSAAASGPKMAGDGGVIGVIGVINKNKPTQILSFLASSPPPKGCLEEIAF
jgi:hypothetical protein